MTQARGRVLPQELVFDAERVAEQIRQFLRVRLNASGLETFVLGLSGGVDSACAAALAVQAVGVDHLLTVKLPSATSTPESQRDAERVEEALGIPTQRRLLVEVGPMVAGWQAAIGEDDPSPLRTGNVAARSRMVVLWDLAMKDRGVVLGTENRTESLLGYFTIYGDAGSAVEPIASLYKSQVWALADHLGVPTEVITKDPTADLWTGQTDEIELGVSYADADRVLHWLLDRGIAASDVSLASGLTAEVVQKVIDRYEATGFKRELPYRFRAS